MLISKSLWPYLQHDATAFQCAYGIEKESLRIGMDGRISQKPHPSALGAALCHSQITTDYSEALSELITPKQSFRISQADYLHDLHRYVLSHMHEEAFWHLSMPCAFDADHEIPIAQYGTSNQGRMKRLYREGLAHRYGRMMQCIAGIHFNFSYDDALFRRLYQEEAIGCSFQSYQSARYLAVIRNFRRHAWVVHYLFGASPAVDASFLSASAQSEFEQHATQTYLMPEATSLRMSTFGYQTNAQASIQPDYNELSHYIQALSSAMHSPHAQYERMGMLNAEGQQQQLNTALLQIENEHYTEIRPKPNPIFNGRPLSVLKQEGIHYIEVRCLDLDPFEPTGISTECIHFMSVLLVHCFIEESPALVQEEEQQIRARLQKVARFGRQPQLSVPHEIGEIPLQVLGEQLFEGLRKTAIWLDQVFSLQNLYQSVIERYAQCIFSPETITSGRLIKYMTEHRVDHQSLGLQHAYQFKQHFMQSTYIDPMSIQSLEQQAITSKIRQKQLEAEGTIGFQEYLKAYYKT